MAHPLPPWEGRVGATSESRHGFRRSWPKKKARAHRSYRRGVRQWVSSVLRLEEIDSLLPDATVRRRRPRKWGATPLGEYVRERRERRKGRAGEKIARRSPRLAQYLRELLSSRPDENDWTRRVAGYLKKLLRPAPSERRKINRSLYVFFRDQPTWETRDLAWSRSARRR